MSENLGPVYNCPECGEFPTLVETTIDDSGGSIGAVACRECRLIATASTTQDAILLWNGIEKEDDD
jgi:transcription elongation factor Elf1